MTVIQWFEMIMYAQAFFMTLLVMLLSCALVRFLVEWPFKKSEPLTPIIKVHSVKEPKKARKEHRKGGGRPHDETIKSIKRDINIGLSDKALSEKYNMRSHAIANIRAGKSFARIKP